MKQFNATDYVSRFLRVQPRTFLTVDQVVNCAIADALDTLDDDCSNPDIRKSIFDSFQKDKDSIRQLVLSYAQAQINDILNKFKNFTCQTQNQDIVPDTVGWICQVQSCPNLYTATIDSNNFIFLTDIYLIHPLTVGTTKKLWIIPKPFPISQIKSSLVDYSDMLLPDDIQQILNFNLKADYPLDYLNQIADMLKSKLIA